MEIEQKARDLSGCTCGPNEGCTHCGDRERIEEALEEARRDGALQMQGSAAHLVQHYWTKNGGSTGRVNRAFIGCSNEVRGLDPEDVVEDKPDEEVLA